MAGKILTIKEAGEIAHILREQKKRIVLTGGCFDILHVGHIKLLERAKKAGDVLFVLLESDEKITQIKGNGRPLHEQDDRAYMLSAINFVDYVVCLPFLTTDTQYDQIVSLIHPSVIAVTKGDRAIEHKKRQAAEVGATVLDVIEYIPNKSSSAALHAILGEK